MPSTTDSFQAFLAAGAVAILGLGGTFLISQLSSERETQRQIASLLTKVDMLTDQVNKLQPISVNGIALGIRVELVEKRLSEQQEALKAFQANLVPMSLQRR